MGSVGNPNPWAPYDTYKDCSQGICSIYCPQWCYIIFPPPPPDYYADDNSATDFSPLIIAVIGILVSAFLLVSYYTIISKYCRRRRNEETATEFDENRAQIMNSENWQASSDGLDEALVKSITVCKYKKNDGLVEGTDCAVCLSEFQENESLRLLPKCNHAFHLPCIDTWLKSHSSCPLCRANIASTATSAFHQTPSVQEIATNINISALEHRIRTDAILVVEDLESGVREGAAVVRVEIQPFRRSASLNSLCAERPVLIADILRHGEDEDDGEFDVGNLGFSVGIGSSKEFGKQNERMKRSVSTGRFVFPRCSGRGRNCIIPN